jgi:hypothetical protein
MLKGLVSIRPAFRSSLRRFGGHAPKNEAFPSFEWKREVILNPEPVTNDDKAYFGGRKPGTPLEGWEWIYGVTMLAALGILLEINLKPDESISVCFDFSSILVLTTHRPLLVKKP